ncbi:M48 family metalloprotease [Kovacikia minuta CCNUW1]|uniref:M48 family metallopeptidase n=1 Tax=Kovacikia minuta TaxID=2931930 RepID=UPI001CCE6DC6|nr:M48 family metallopeptidase [Kovacikia minuta]UBF26251.1 M48 family metalloprotease [Kovacikia minuta CCNUW1]
MLNRFSRLSRRSRGWIYPLISLAVALGLWLGQPVVARAISWGDLILQGIQVIQLSNVSDQQEVQLGRQINNELVRRQIRLYRDPRLQQYVNQIGQRLAANSSRPNIPYTFQVVDDSSVNAFATMGGFVYVNKGLLKLADNEAQLTSVMGHEIGHVAGQHALKQMKEAAIAQGVASLAGVNRNVLVNIGVDLALKRPNSRNDEFEADKMGLQTLGRSGYAQSAMVAFMTKLLKNSSAVPTFLSSHPATSDRVARLKQAIDPNRANVGDGLDNAAYRARIQGIS